MGSAFCFIVRFGMMRVDLVAASSTVEFSISIPKNLKINSYVKETLSLD